jgi:hypothetical protein
MITTAIGSTILCAAFLFILGCNAESTDDGDYYNEMTSNYDTYTVGGVSCFMDSSSCPELDSCDYCYVNSRS